MPSLSTCLPCRYRGGKIIIIIISSSSGGGGGGGGGGGSSMLRVSGQGANAPRKIPQHGSPSSSAAVQGGGAWQRPLISQLALMVMTAFWSPL